jgi:hypothetical protein
MTARSKDIIFLLGAGASAEADIPVSGAMIDRVEQHLHRNDDWKEYRPLYHHVKSAIHFSAGLRGNFHDSVPFNIETLVNALYELERNEEHPLYPFIASWNSRFVDLAGAQFSRVKKFRRLILAELKKWMCPEKVAKGNYYQGLATLQRDLNYPLHVFSLNYDMCVERLNRADVRVETGFSDYGPEHPWSWERFEEAEAGETPLPNMYLYKLHGSINWKRDEQTKNLFSVEQIESVQSDSMEIIFGRDFKLEAADPYLFFAYQFRRFVLLTKLIVVVGYGFGDSHINKMLTQGIRCDSERRLIVVQRCAKDACPQKEAEIARKLELEGATTGQVVVQPGSAKEFLETPNLAQFLMSKVPASADVPF